jgi:hypothetical protein
MSPDINADWTVEGADTALDAAGTIRQDISLDKRLASGFFLLSYVAYVHDISCLELL